jgi:hypothetical protein
MTPLIAPINQPYSLKAMTAIIEGIKLVVSIILFLTQKVKHID